MPRLGIVADYRAESEAHRAADLTFELAQRDLGYSIDLTWIPTASAGDESLRRFDAVLVGTGVYDNRDNVIRALRFTRENLIPTLATCGGFQHMIIEYARNVLGLTGVGHAEFDTDADHVIVPLDCSLRGRDLDISLSEDSQVGNLCGTTRTQERFYCSFGVAPTFVGSLSASKLRVSGSDAEGLIRVTELTDHPFYIGTLFVPQARALVGSVHPIVVGLIEAGRARSSRAG